MFSFKKISDGLIMFPSTYRSPGIYTFENMSTVGVNTFIDSPELFTCE